MIGTGGFLDTPNQRLRHPPRPADHRSGDPRRGHDRGRAERQAAAPERRGPRGRGPSAAGRRRGHQRRPRPAADRREVPVGQHARGDQRASRRRWRRCAPGCPASTSTRPFSGRRPSSRCRSTISAARSDLGALLVMLILAAFLYEWRIALISCRGDSAVADGRRAGPVPARHDDQHDGPGRVRDRPRRRGGRRDHRRRERRPAPATTPPAGQRTSRRHGSFSTPRSRCATRSSTRP